MAMLSDVSAVSSSRIFAAAAAAAAAHHAMGAASDLVQLPVDTG